MIKQSIIRDTHSANSWDRDSMTLFNVNLLNPACFEIVTGFPAPRSPVSAAHYHKMGLPLFTLPESEASGIKGKFKAVKSVARMDEDNGKPKTQKQIREEQLRFKIVELNRSGHHRGFTPVSEMERGVRRLNIAQF